MLKLYKKIDGKIHYWETWDKNEKTGIVHWGIIGDEGQNEEISSGWFSPFHKKIQTIVNEKINDGYEQVDLDDHHILLIEYKIDGMGTTDDLEKRNRLQEKMDHVLGWTGLGHCDGGSTGGGTMEVCCFVVDFNIAKAVIEQSLKNTEFEDYTQIYDENE